MRDRNEYMKKYNEKNKEKRKLIQARFYKKHKAKINKYQATYRKNKGKIIAY